MLFPQYHSYRMDEASMCDSLMISLHRICEIPTTCQCKWLLAFPTARRIFVDSFPSPEKFAFRTDKIESIEWLNLVPWLSVGDCFESHLLRWGLCDLLLSSHQNVWPNLRWALVILVRKQTSQFRSVGKWVKKMRFFDAIFVGRSES